MPTKQKQQMSTLGVLEALSLPLISDLFVKHWPGYTASLVIKFCCILKSGKLINILAPGLHPQRVWFDWSQVQSGHWNFLKHPFAILACLNAWELVLEIRSNIMRGQKICLMADVSVGKSGLVSTFKNLISTFLIKCVLSIISETITDGSWKNSSIHHENIS